MLLIYGKFQVMLPRLSKAFHVRWFQQSEYQGTACPGLCRLLLPRPCNLLKDG